MTTEQKAALERLIAIAKAIPGRHGESPTFCWHGGTRASAEDSTLRTCGALMRSIAEDMVIVFGYVARANAYPDALGFNAEFQSIVRGWRPELAD